MSGQISMPTSTVCVCGDMIQCAESGYNAFVPHVNRRTGQQCNGFPLQHRIPEFIEIGEGVKRMTQTYPPEWFMEMARLIKARDHANAMVIRWQRRAADAETAIAALSNGTVAVETAPEQE